MQPALPRALDLRPPPQPGVERLGRQPALGDQALLDDQATVMVWDPVFAPGALLGKVKYARHDDSGGSWKVAHSFTEAALYLEDLSAIGRLRQTPFGGSAAVFTLGEVRSWYPRLPARESGVVPGLLVDLLGSAGIGLERVWLTGSRAHGRARSDSDVDLVVEATTSEVRRLRDAVAYAVSRRDLRIPAESGTWRRLAGTTCGGSERIVRERRFVETVEVGEQRVAMILERPGGAGRLASAGLVSLGHGRRSGRVTAAAEAPYKRAEFTLDAAGERLRVVSYHKTANLVQVGDDIEAAGWLNRTPAGTLLVQFDPDTDGIFWLDEGQQ